MNGTVVTRCQLNYLQIICDLYPNVIGGVKSNLRKDLNLDSDLGPDFHVWKLN